MKVTFLGAAQTVTGSKYLLEFDSHKILVDCGLYQGRKEYRLRNWQEFPVDPKSIQAILLTHAHIDHSGFLPVLIKRGFSGDIFCTSATRDLCEILLADSGHLQEEEARFANKHGFSKHKPALPLYTREEGQAALKYFKVIEFNKPYSLNHQLTFNFKCIGHILGAACILAECNGTSILFSGDMGRLDNPLALPPETVDRVDYLILESTYGNRLHDKVDPLKQFEDIINRTIKRGGSVIIPSFAVGRAQLVLYYLYQLKKENRIPNVPVYLDSPMAIDATEIFCQHAKYHRLTKELAREACSVAKYVTTPEESKSLDSPKTPSIIISASGMATGGRILHHLKVYLKDHNSTVLFVGYQAGGTRGDRLVSGEKEIKIHGQMIPVEAEVIGMENLSAHADYQEILTWLKHFKEAPKKVFLTHGELRSAEGLKAKIEEIFGWKCYIPEYLQAELLS